MMKVREDVEDWFAAQVVEGERKFLLDQEALAGSTLEALSPAARWFPPPLEWFKCTVGLSWSRRNSLAGVAWVLRNDLGNVLMHSRRTFTNINSLVEAHFLSIVWAVESMVSHRINRVIFGVESAVLKGVMNRPQAWPSFKYQASEIMEVLKVIADWRVCLESVASNRGANLLRSVLVSDPAPEVRDLPKIAT
ncbi:Ribonuclease H domain [Arabidopsis thaliana x Arabidopsis arenosa]|uniref:Ribonuclease H domain n=1 Tax=Arabidopsis thaliana x Arabidopsis arenosa TaxID=1240361 RepID=A0A8T1Y6X1_9BRAS|nr:Ribonuclease H domain [Arabidopsis thaliana x Arabidopsis arenosa]